MSIQDLKQNPLQYIKDHRRSFIIGLSLLLVFIAAVILRFLTPSPKAPVTTTGQQTRIKSPDLSSPLGSTDQTLEIVWNNPQFTPPSSLPYYSSTTSLLNSQNVNDIAQTLGFTPDQRIPTNSLNNLIWIFDKLSLSINLPFGPLSFIDANDPPDFPPTPLDSQIASAQQNLTTLFPGAQFSNQPELTQYFTVDSDSNTLQPATAASAQLTRLSFTQSIDQYPYITSSPLTSPITMVLNNLNQIQQLQVIGGASQIDQASDSLPLLTIDQLKQIAPQKARKLSSTSIETEAAVSSQSSLTFTVEKLDLAYLSLPSDKTLQPVYRLTGILTGHGIDPTPATYFVPAFQSQYYQ